MITGVHLITGLIGSGKTLRAVWYIDQEIKAGRAVYACNLNGINIPGVMPWEDPKKWQELPPGALLVVDEAQRYWRARRAGEVPEELQAMETSRHDAVSFLILTQQPSYLDKHLRGLVTRHEHLYRRMGANASALYSWERCIDDPMNATDRDGSDQSMFVYPKHLFGAYKSSEQHTVKFKMGTRAKMIVGALALALGLFGYTFATLGSDQPKAEPKAGSVALAPASDTERATAAPGRTFRYATADEYRIATSAVVPAAPWTAPVYQDRKVAAEPALYCASSAPGEDSTGEWREASCSCITEQGTPYVLPANECRLVARQGTPYNPYKQVKRDTQRQQTASGARTERSGPAPTAVQLDADQVTGYGDIAEGES